MRLLFKMKPLEPYFLGGERIFLFDEQKKDDISSGSSYFIRSQLVPQQTTLLGMLRKQLLKVNGLYHENFSDYKNEDEGKRVSVIGEKSFEMGNGAQSFGHIEKVEPVFIMDGENPLLPLPFDMNNTDESGKYTPCTYPENEKVKVSLDGVNGCGDKVYPKEYESKIGIADGFANPDGAVFKNDDIFVKDVHTQINLKIRDSDDPGGGLFRKEYVMFKKPSLRFAFCASIADESAKKLCEKPDIVTIGQGKSPFLLTAEVNEKIKFTNYDNSSSNRQRIICLSDAVLTGDVYNDCSFAFVKTKSFRSLSFNEKGKGDASKRYSATARYTVVCAGSVFITNGKEQTEELLKKFKTDENAGTLNIGMNAVWTSKEETKNG